MLMFLAASGGIGFVGGLVTGVVLATALWIVGAPDPYRLRREAIDARAMADAAAEDHDAVVRVWVPHDE